MTEAQATASRYSVVRVSCYVMSKEIDLLIIILYVNIKLFTLCVVSSTTRERGIARHSRRQ